MQSLFAATLLVATAAAPAGDLVTTLPGFGPPPTPWYSGYLDIPGGKHLHYIFITSPNPSKDPVTAWFNGGPGCSSLEGLFQEMGQLWVDEQDPTKLVVNSNAWTNVSSMVFLESPACVGYSYADTIEGCAHNDSSQAVDTYAAYLKFFELFPEYAANSFYITGESYAGIYVPTLAQQIVLGNKAGNPRINLKACAVGNGCVGHNVGTCAFDYLTEINTNIPYYYGHGLISPSTYAATVAACPTQGENPSQTCNNLIDQAHSEVGNVNTYNIYGDCTLGSTIDKGVIDKVSGKRVYTKAPVVMREGGPIACIDETIAKYLTREDVATALNVIPTLNWAVCGSNSSFDYTRTEADERFDVYPDIYNALIDVLIYNGEGDACVPWLDNNNWVASMNFTVSKPWTSWESLGQNAGYVTQYTSPSGSRFDFATVKGAGHMVPEIRPSQAWTMFAAFINGTALA